MVIDKRAFFALRFAENMRKRSLDERASVMIQLHPEARPVVTKALTMLMQAKTSGGTQ